MPSDTIDATQHEDLDVVRDYFAHWIAYQRAVECNYIHHREARAALRGCMAARGPAGSLLDLGCGDAATIPDLVDGLGMTSYTGVDVTPEALDVAARSIAALGVPARLVAADFTVELPRLPGPYDTIVVSLAMHHLPAHDKPAFFAAVRAQLAPGGLLLAYEPSCRPSEGRARYVARQAAYFTANFTRMTPAHVAMLNQHVADADFPESPGAYAALAIDAGFTRADVLYVDPEHFWAALAFRP